MEVLQWISLDHFHPHDLAFCEKEAIHLNGCEEIFCSACLKSLLDTSSFYYCGECYFFLHKTCSELPRLIKHHSHHKHPLMLHPNSPYGSNTSVCDLCGLEIVNFLYNCSDCNFDIDIDCALLALCFTQPESHKHHFTKWGRSDPFTCDFCGIYSDQYRFGFSSKNLLPWICTNCHVVVHNECVSLPFTVHLPQHDHPFIHTYFIPESHQSIALICGICCQQVNGEFGCYSCQNCPSVVHVNCALDFKVEKVGQKFWAEEIEAAEEQLVEQEIEHFIHPHHKLFLVQNHDDDDDHEIETKCDGCMRIISYPFYKCLECDFYLHIACSKLPKQINHPLHEEHPLTLVPNNDNLVFYCWACSNPYHGFTYHCLTCMYFRIDVRCAFVNPFEFNHDGHNHPLSLFTQNNKCLECTSCGKACPNLLRCKERCPFALDYGCVTLPRTFKYEYDEHPLVLSYQQNDDSNGYLYCDVCDQDRDPNHWFYGCPNYLECPIYLHPDCAHGDYPYVKLGSSIKDPDLHEHELFFIQRNQDFLPCQLCSKIDQKLSVECCKEGCNFSVHCECTHWDCDLDDDDDDEEEEEEDNDSDNNDDFL